ncbi:MAG: hypothetical protein KIT09_05585 [Bryobacteraceae bacterium]|nr:hypothetical protein [Bryobacteraceae bacterium]
MLRRILALTLAAAMLAPAQRAKPSLREQALGIPAGALVEVTLARKERPNKIAGRMSETTPEGIWIEVVKDRKATAMEFAFSEVKSLKIVRGADEDPPRKGTTLTVLAAAGLIIVFAFLEALADT